MPASSNAARVGPMKKFLREHGKQSLPALRCFLTRQHAMGCHLACLWTC